MKEITQWSSAVRNTGGQAGERVVRWENWWSGRKTSGQSKEAFFLFVFFRSGLLHQTEDHVTVRVCTLETDTLTAAADWHLRNIVHFQSRPRH